jgi:protein-S-isoprenylcysteine O-methyltransferase Ste14
MASDRKLTADEALPPGSQPSTLNRPHTKTSGQRKNPVFIRRLIIAVVWNTLCFGGFLFLVAGTFHWWRAWVLQSVATLATIAMMVGVLRDREDLLKERMKGIIQKGQPWIDRAVVLPFVFSFGLLFWLIPNDVFRFHLLPRPGVVVSSLGLLMFVVGWWIIALSFAANAFAIPVVKHQTERQHVVVDSGVYGIVRHPMYVGVILFMIGMPLWLESYAGALLALVPSALLVVRILIEERFLRRELAGYDEYTHRVRYRLMPWVW